ncbi:hypothetical protein A2U01_0089238, partial [Trifolium medium]|nr:hypothetical protein [Trifolium medium]
MWRRQLWVWEEEILGECQDLLHDLSLHVQQSVTLEAADELVWHKQ